MGDGSVALILDVTAIIQMGQTTNYLTGAMPFAHQTHQLQNQSNA
jgi:two-component system chemotaxis sensor kinase CheA